MPFLGPVHELTLDSIKVGKNGVGSAGGKQRINPNLPVDVDLYLGNQDTTFLLNLKDKLINLLSRNAQLFKHIREINVCDIAQDREK